MSTPTPNQGFTKSAGSEAADVAVINANWDIADAMATLTQNQTLTNKTLTSPHMTSPVVDSGGLTITSGALTLGAAASQIVPGATSLSLRNNANNADNLLITDAGNVTIRNGLIVSAGVANFSSIDVALGTGSIANGATSGFPYIASGGGAPSGVPSGISGLVPIRYDTSSHKLWAYDGGWKGVVLS